MLMLLIVVLILLFGVVDRQCVGGSVCVSTRRRDLFPERVVALKTRQVDTKVASVCNRHRL
jgi:hypothetical protein